MSAAIGIAAVLANGLSLRMLDKSVCLECVRRQQHIMVLNACADPGDARPNTLQDRSSMLHRTVGRVDCQSVPAFEGESRAEECCGTACRCQMRCRRP